MSDADEPGPTDHAIDGGPSMTEPTTPSVAAAAAPAALDRFLPMIAIGTMIVTFIAVNPFAAMTMIALIWLVGTRLNRSRRLLGLTLTEALAWVATVAIIEFVSIVVLYGVGGARAP